MNCQEIFPYRTPLTFLKFVRLCPAVLSPYHPQSVQASTNTCYKRGEPDWLDPFLLVPLSLLLGGLARPGDIAGSADSVFQIAEKWRAHNDDSSIVYFWRTPPQRRVLGAVIVGTATPILNARTQTNTSVISASRVRRVTKAGHETPPGPVAVNTNASTSFAALILGAVLAGAALHLALENLSINVWACVCNPYQGDGKCVNGVCGACT
jgi:hypothetical protein